MPQQQVRSAQPAAQREDLKPSGLELEVAAILPSNTPAASTETSPWSSAAIVVTVNGTKTGDPNSPYFYPRVNIVKSATGLYTLDSSGAGRASSSIRMGR